MLRIYIFILLFGSHCFADVTWQTIAEDLELTRISLIEENFLTPEILFIKTSLKKFDPVVIDSRDFGMNRATVSNIATKSKLALAINANFFDQNGAALGLVIHQGLIRNKLHRGGKTLTGVFYFGRGKSGIVNRNDYNPTKVVEAIQAGPRLLSAGRKLDLSSQDIPTKRAGICINKSENLLFYISSGLFGISLDDLQDVLLKAGCEDALNLDGGGSAQLFLSGDLTGNEKSEDFIIAGRDPVPVVFGLAVKH